MTVAGADRVGAPLFDEAARTYDAVLIMSFGGPEGPDDVMPFLRNVVSGRAVPEDRLQDVAAHYERFGGVSPINAQNRALRDALEGELRTHGLDLPVYLGNRNWHPLVGDTIRRMRDDGVSRVVAFVTSAFSCYSGCRQYRENIVQAQATVPDAPAVDKLRVFFNHPGFVEPFAHNVRAAHARLGAAGGSDARVVFTAHSIPAGMAAASRYQEQLGEACRLVAEVGGLGAYDLVFQSRSGAHQPWLEPDILDHLRRLRDAGVTKVVVAPIGFLSDHMEVLYDLDHEAAEMADELGMQLVRAQTVGTAPRFVAMIRELIQERMTDHPARLALGAMSPSHDVCPLHCCARTADRAMATAPGGENG